ncbi:MAG TPA: zinc ribbon domain-containing protein [Spirochaetota bacterium]|nr:zinc ribbon domain-containing protein [Spirochaetota bacterium]OPZ39294.1 MAG: Zinc ribbon domain protein [Spirochaetes bacterium ADurb.BinA120]HNU90284.1 zinc ribbon domain-containing protein [Spirochaetota bacterium]HPI13227.1 zinc ribbon domain-containing protein [Spirochaetota bacterium]HPO45097.1 zinc ribbon domain-containing protein [Spirochaetota bacterium]
MPVYEFRCAECGATTSELRRMGDYTPPVCTRCGSAHTEKMFSMFGGAGSGANSCGSCTPSHPGA